MHTLKCLTMNCDLFSGDFFLTYCGMFSTPIPVICLKPIESLRLMNVIQCYEQEPNILLN
jgi:hypothetical protein